MGLIQAAVGAIGGTLADQWKDFYTVPDGLPPTAALFSAVPRGTNAGRGSNTRGSSNIITNGSRIVVPEGYGLLLMQDGAVTAFVAEAGAYEWNSNDLQSQSIFSGGGLFDSLVRQSWERFKFGGQPGAQQAAFFVSMKELPDNRFGTQSEIYWDDGYLNAQVGAITRGSYTLQIVDPIRFVKSFVPASYLQPGQVFDFTDLDNAAASQLFNEVVSSLAPAFSLYANDPDNAQLGANVDFNIMEEVEIVTGGMPAEVGIASGGYVNAVTRSGGNKFSGLFQAFYNREPWSTTVVPEDQLRALGLGLPAVAVFNYDLTGSVDDPQVSVNPLSILTPGMFREHRRRDRERLNPELQADQR